MNQSEITLAKFKACLHSSMTKIGVFNLYEKKKLKEYEHSVFSKILIKYDLEEYDTLLFEYFCEIIKTNNLNASSYYDAIVDEEPDNFRLELLKVYQFLHERNKELTDSIVLKKSQTHTIKSEQLISEIEKFIDGLFGNYFKKTDPTQQNIELLIRKYENSLLHNEGTPAKNQHLTILSSELADLIRIDRLLQSNTIVDIDQIKVKPNDRKFIFECLSFWKFIDPKITTTPNTYIRTIFDQGTIFFPEGYFDDRRMRLARLKSKINPLI